MEQVWEALEELFRALGNVLAEHKGWVAPVILFAVWVAWWLWGVNWRKAWTVLGRGAWVPVVLLMVTVALVWSQMEPGDCDCLPFVTVSNFWWQLGAVGLLAAVTLFCGWLQGVFGWGPAELDLEPPPAVIPGPGHEHPLGTMHGHEYAHSDDQPGTGPSGLGQH